MRVNIYTSSVLHLPKKTSQNSKQKSLLHNKDLKVFFKRSRDNIYAAETWKKTISVSLNNVSQYKT